MHTENFLGTKPRDSHRPGHFKDSMTSVKIQNKNMETWIPAQALPPISHIALSPFLQWCSSSSLLAHKFQNFSTRILVNNTLDMTTKC